MTRIHDQLTKINATRSLLLALALVTIISISGSESTAMGQSIDDVCHQTQAVLTQQQREYKEIAAQLVTKQREGILNRYFWAVDHALRSNVYLSHQDLNSIALTLNMNLTKEVGRMTLAERWEFQRTAWTTLWQRLNEVKDVSEGELNDKVIRLRQQIAQRLQRLTLFNCGQSGTGDVAVNIPTVMSQQENGCHGTWTRNGNQISAVWENGAKAILIIQQFDNNQVEITREDSPGSVSYGFKAKYTGTLSGNSIINGKVTWSSPGRSDWSGTWSASW